MTTGTVYQPGGYPGYNSLLFKHWTGTDGKYLVDGRDKWNAYSMDLIQESDQIGNATHALSTTSGAVPVWTSADESLLQSRLVEQVRGHNFNLAVNIAQAHQLIEMCSSTILHFGRALLYLKHGNVAGATRELGIKGKNKRLKGRDVSSRWLELQYGWLPSISDAFEAAKAFEAISNGRKARIVASVKRTYDYNGSAEPSNYTSAGKTVIKKRIVYEMEEELSLARSLGLLDPLSVVWEVIPYSFVVDWFLPIGTYLDNLSVIPKLKGRFLSTRFSRTDARVTEIKTKDPLYQGAKRVGHQIELRRDVLTGLTPQLPTFVNPITALSRARIANAVALAHQLISS
uniref:Uncharacterized protein n=1 Tax=Leviviridae sp. TaxID=2027243 RepID=A0A514D5M8_9VIRU|nr:MAG: hypothetical protein H1RhizoLitter1543_000003 [Leviviridae sp.]